MDYISTHDGASTTLLLSESPQNPVGGVVNSLPSTTPYLCVYKAAAEGGAPSTGTAYYYRPYPTWILPGRVALRPPMNWISAFQMGFTPDSTDREWFGGWGKREVRNIFASCGGMINTSFCDGHQYALIQDIDVNVFRHLMTP